MTWDKLLIEKGFQSDVVPRNLGATKVNHTSHEAHHDSPII